MDFDWRAARTSARLRVQVSRAMAVMDTRIVTIRVVMVIATISSMSVNPLARRDFRGVFMKSG
jgi:hypothetical protein